MRLNNKWLEEDIKKLHELEPDEFDPPILVRPEHERFAERIRKTLYYGKLPTEDRPSLPMTEIAVNYIRVAAPKELGKIDMYFASEVGRKACVSPCSMMLGMIYIERLKHKNPEYLDHVSSSDLFLISMMVASKYLYDEGIDEEVYNDEWAESADMATEDVNQIERDFLQAINWSLFSQPEDFERLLTSMEEKIAFKQGLGRGYWTYTDAMVLLQNTRFSGSLRDVLHEMCKVVLVCSVAYTAGLATMVASMTTLSLLRTHCPVAMQTMVAIKDTPLFSTTTEDGSIDVSTTDEELGQENFAMDNNVDDYHDHEHLSLFANIRPADLEHGHRYLEDSLGHTLLDSNSSEDALNENKTTGLTYLTLPGLLTLTLIKDTVTQFLVALESEDDEFETKSTGNDCSSRSPKCMCPHCPLKTKRERKRNLKFGATVPPYSVWSSMKHLNGHDYSRSTPKVIGHFEGRDGQGQIGEIGVLTPDREIGSGDPDSKHGRVELGGYHSDWLHRCPVLKERGLKWSLVPQCLQQHIAIDMPLGFQTASVVIA